MFRLILEPIKLASGVVAALATGALALGALAGIAYAVFALVWPPLDVSGEAGTVAYLAAPYAAFMAGMASAWGGRATLAILAWAQR